MFVGLAFSQESSVTVVQLYRFPQNDIRQHSCMTLIIDQNSIFRQPPTFLIFFFLSALPTGSALCMALNTCKQSINLIYGYQVYLRKEEQSQIHWKRHCTFEGVSQGEKKAFCVN